MPGPAAFKFVNTSKPRENLSPANRKLVRSNATLQRSKKRRRVDVAKDECKTTNDQVLSHYQPIPLQMSRFSVKMQQNIYSMLEYQENVVGPSLFPWKGLHDLHPGQRILMCFALHDERVMHSSVAISALWLLHTEKLSPGDSRTWQVMALGHKQRAIELLKAHFSSDISGSLDVGTALSMMNLASLELIAMNETGWLLHMQALRKIANSAEARSALCTARFTVFDVDLLGCYMFGQRPFFSFEGVQPDMISLHADQKIMIGVSNDYDETNNRNKPGSDILSETLQNALVGMRRIDRFIEEASETQYLQMHVQAYLVTRFSIEYTLLGILGRDDVDLTSKVVCIAAQVYTNRLYRTFERNAEVPHFIAIRLQEPLQLLLRECQDSNKKSELILWAAMLGYIGTRDGEEPQQFFSATISSVCMSMGWTTWTDILEHLKSWLWCEHRLEHESELLWSNVKESFDHSYGLPDWP